MTRVRWGAKLLAILGVALVAAAAAAALPDNPYQRWQLVENTLLANATWSYERIHFDPRPIDVAIVGASRSEMGLSAPAMAARLRALGQPLEVANLSVVEDGRNLTWAIVDELFRAKRPRVLVVLVEETAHPWGSPGFRYIAPAAALAVPPTPLLHNYLGDLVYLPYRQLLLAAARIAPGVVGLRDRFDPQRFAAKPDDYSVTRRLADGKVVDMDAVHSPAALLAAERAFEATRHPSHLPAAIRRLTDVDEPVYVAAIARTAAARGTKIVFVFLPHFAGATTIDNRAFYAARGVIADDGDLSTRAELFQDFAHLNRRGALIASDRLADVIAAEVAADRPRSATPGVAG